MEVCAHWRSALSMILYSAQQKPNWHATRTPTYGVEGDPFKVSSFCYGMFGAWMRRSKPASSRARGTKEGNKRRQQRDAGPSSSIEGRGQVLGVLAGGVQREMQREMQRGRHPVRCFCLAALSLHLSSETDCNSPLFLIELSSVVARLTYCIYNYS